MPRVSRSVSQRYANASKKKPKRRGETGRAAILPPQVPEAPVELPAGLASPAPLDLHGEASRPTRPILAGRPAARAAARGEARLGTRRLATAPIIDYSYVSHDLRRIAIVATLLLLGLFALAAFVPGLR
ncbi:MAG TPA: hypothetical protein VK066_32280 [Chloroflexota bacterium]|nr:hypothetical protein [Chloroflexota bacterium]